MVCTKEIEVTLTAKNKPLPVDGSCDFLSCILLVLPGILYLRKKCGEMMGVGLARVKSPPDLKLHSRQN